MKITILLISICLYVFAINPIAFQFTKIKVNHTYLDGKTKELIIERKIDKECLNIPINPESFDEKNIKEKISTKCKKEFITTAGIIQPIILDKEIQTLGENEVLSFIYNKSNKNPEKYALVDTRKAIWFEKETIPGSKNVPYEDLAYDEDFEEDFYKAYNNLGIKITNKNKFDFKNAKEIVLFCNGSWCPISTKTIKYLISIGFPKEKISWYRGGLNNWKSLSLSTTKN